jgi:hypothetical protein
MKRYILILTFITLSAVSCNLLDMNNDPNNPTKSSVNLVLPAGEASAAYIFGGQFQVLGGIWAQHWTSQHGGPQYIGIDAYSVTVDAFDRPWDELYSGSLNDLEWVKNTAKDAGNWNYYLMATVMQCYTYQMLDDLYDQIPFTEALQKTNPHYDAGTVVYDGLIARLNEALSHDLSTSVGTIPGTDDCIFQGNMNNWIKFANTLKLKIYLRQVYARPDVASAGIQSLAGASFLDVDAAYSLYGTSANQRNPFYETEVFRFGSINVGASTTVISGFATGDARMGDARHNPNLLFKTPVDLGPQVGMQEGYGPVLTSTPTAISIENVTAQAPVYFMTAAESYFLQAEAALRGYSTGNASALYNQGIAAAYTRLGLAATNIPTDYAYPASADMETNLKAIITQKWLSMTNIEGLEAFIEFNRTHYPDFLAVSETSVLPAGQFPKRLYFPQAEVQTNPLTPAQPAGITTKVWWDKKN